MNHWYIRLALSLVAGLTYFAGAIPESLTFEQLSVLPVQVWILMFVNMLTGLLSPAMVKNITGNSGDNTAKG